MRILMSCALVAMSLLISACDKTPKTDEEKTLYAIGLAIGGDLASFKFTKSEIKQVKAGLADGVLGREAKVDLQTHGPKIQQLHQSRSGNGAENPEGALSGTELDEAVYAVGLAISRNLGVFKFTEAELEFVNNGLTDSVLERKHKVELQAHNTQIQQLYESRVAAAAAGEKEIGKELSDKAAAEAGSVRKDSGLVYVPIKKGTGRTPKATETVTVHYHGTLADGNVFDSSVQRNTPASFPLNGVIPCWTEALQLMRVGGKAKIVCPSDIAYGDSGRPPTIPGGATLVFEVELLGIKK